MGRLEALAQNFRTISYEETGLAVLALALILVCRKYFPKIPGYIVALFVGTALVYFLHLPVQTIGTRFGGIPSGLPALKMPHFHLDLIRPLIAPAILADSTNYGQLDRAGGRVTASGTAAALRNDPAVRAAYLGQAH